jgi:hypothetical protein
MIQDGLGGTELLLDKPGRTGEHEEYDAIQGVESCHLCMLYGQPLDTNSHPEFQSCTVRTSSVSFFPQCRFPPEYRVDRR